MRIPLYKPLVGKTEAGRLRDVLRSGWVSHKSSTVDAFENRISDYIGVNHGVAVDSGTAAVQLALEAVGVGRGDEVILPGFTFPSVLMAVQHTGATPVLADIERDTLGLSPEEVGDVVSDATAAMIVTHLFGQPARLEALRTIADDHDIVVIEDAAQAFGTTVEGQRLGSFGDIGCFSFSWNKTLTTGKGGIVVTDDETYVDAVTELSLFGRDPDTGRYRRNGYNYRMDGVRASIGIEQCNRLQHIREKKTAILSTYREHLPDVEPGPVDSADIMPWLCFLRTDERDAVTEALEANGIGFRRFYPPLHSLSIAPETPRACPNASAVSRRGVLLPTGPGLGRSEVKEVAEAVSGALQ